VRTPNLTLRVCCTSQFNLKASEDKNKWNCTSTPSYNFTASTETNLPFYLFQYCRDYKLIINLMH